MTAPARGAAPAAAPAARRAAPPRTARLLARTATLGAAGVARTTVADQAHGARRGAGAGLPGR
jgi:hypothetical protein